MVHEHPKIIIDCQGSQLNISAESSVETTLFTRGIYSQTETVTSGYYRWSQGTIALFCKQTNFSLTDTRPESFNHSELIRLLKGIKFQKLRVWSIF